MRISIPKLKAMILFFASNTDERLLGKVKLMKLFYFTDFTSVKKFASPITFDRYVHMEHGPIPSSILNLVNAVESDIDNAILADTFSVETKEGSHQKRIVPTREFSDDDRKYFSEQELEIMKGVCDRFFDKTGKFIEEESHNESAWKMTKEVEEIPYTLAINDGDCSVDREDIKLSLEIMG
jgi:uncharacterized phage-associated protein